MQNTQVSIWNLVGMHANLNLKICMLKKKKATKLTSLVPTLTYITWIRQFSLVIKSHFIGIKGKKHLRGKLGQKVTRKLEMIQFRNSNLYLPKYF